jgi:hypothetical protein
VRRALGSSPSEAFDDVPGCIHGIRGGRLFSSSAAAFAAYLSLERTRGGALVEGRGGSMNVDELAPFGTTRPRAAQLRRFRSIHLHLTAGHNGQ